jgi:hypothetical protein
MKCETCNNLHDGSYGSGRFCNKKCSKTFSSTVKRKEANEKISNSLKGKESPLKGRKFNPLGEEHKEKIKKSLKEHWDNAEKVSDDHKRHKNVIKVIKYRTRKINALPEDANLSLISLIYKYCPEGYHVDHIHALSRGGLHHEDNLQYLPASENCRKCADREYDKSLAIDWRTIVKINA